MQQSPQPLAERTTLPSDSELIERVLRGDLDAYGALVERYERHVRAAAIHAVRDPQLAEDVVQEAFIAAFESLPALRNSTKFGAWLLGIVRRRAARTLRTRRRAPAIVCLADSAAVEPDGLPCGESLGLLELVERLPDRERVLIGLRHFDGHSVTEIARITGRPVGTITKQLSRAHARLRAWLGEKERT